MTKQERNAQEIMSPRIDILMMIFLIILSLSRLLVEICPTEVSNLNMQVSIAPTGALEICRGLEGPAAFPSSALERSSYEGRDVGFSAIRRRVLLPFLQ